MRPGTRVAVLACLVVLAGCSAVTVEPAPSTASPAGEQQGTVTLDARTIPVVEVTVLDVVDGDTIDVRLPDGGEERVRLLGVDTPEVYADNQPAEFEGVPDTEAGAACLESAGENATAFTRQRLAGANVTVAFDPEADRRGGYGRLLAYVYADGSNLNYDLLAAGHARLYDTEFGLRDTFAAAESRARSASRGLWTCRR